MILLGCLKYGGWGLAGEHVIIWLADGLDGWINEQDITLGQMYELDIDRLNGYSKSNKQK
jgi:hypothetical protein